MYCLGSPVRVSIPPYQPPYHSPHPAAARSPCPAQCPYSDTHPCGNLIDSVAPGVSLGLGDSVEAGQVRTVTPRRGHPPSARASASWGPSGSPSSAGLHAALSTSTAKRGRWLLGAVAWICFRITTHTSGSSRSTFGIRRCGFGSSPGCIVRCG